MYLKKVIILTPFIFNILFATTSIPTEEEIGIPSKTIQEKNNTNNTVNIKITKIPLIDEIKKNREDIKRLNMAVSLLIKDRSINDNKKEVKQEIIKEEDFKILTIEEINKKEEQILAKFLKEKKELEKLRKIKNNKIKEEKEFKINLIKEKEEAEELAKKEEKKIAELKIKIAEKLEKRRLIKLKKEKEARTLAMLKLKRLKELKKIEKERLLFENNKKLEYLKIKQAEYQILKKKKDIIDNKRKKIKEEKRLKKIKEEELLALEDIEKRRVELEKKEIELFLNNEINRKEIESMLITETNKLYLKNKKNKEEKEIIEQKIKDEKDFIIRERNRILDEEKIALEKAIKENKLFKIKLETIPMKSKRITLKRLKRFKDKELVDNIIFTEIKKNKYLVETKTGYNIKKVKEDLLKYKKIFRSAYITKKEIDKNEK